MSVTTPHAPTVSLSSSPPPQSHPPHPSVRSMSVLEQALAEYCRLQGHFEQFVSQACFTDVDAQRPPPGALAGGPCPWRIPGGVRARLDEPVRFPLPRDNRPQFDLTHRKISTQKIGHHGVIYVQFFLHLQN